MTTPRILVPSRVPLVVAHLLVAAYVAVRGTGHELGALPVLAVGVAFGIDGGLFVLARVQETMARGATVQASIDGFVTRSGRKIAGTALAMAAAVVGLTLSSNDVAADLATALATWMAASALTAAIVLPILLVALRPAYAVVPTRVRERSAPRPVIRVH